MMRTLLSKLEPRDLIAIIVVIGGLILIGLGHNGTIGSLLLAVVAFYFGSRYAVQKINGGNGSKDIIAKLNDIEAKMGRRKK